MNWMIEFGVAAGLFLASVAVAILLYVFNKQGRVITSFYIVFGGLFLSVCVCLAPILYCKAPDGAFSALKTVMLSIHGSIQIFTANTDQSIIQECAACMDDAAYIMYSTYLSVAFVVCPVMTFGFIISFFKNLSAYIRYLGHFFCEAYIFSELNEKSLALGADIKKHHKWATIVFTNVNEKENGVSGELLAQARGLHAICFKKDLLSVRFHWHSKGKDPDKAKGKTNRLVFFTFSENEAENMRQSLRLLEVYKNRRNTHLYVLSTGQEGEMILAKADKGKVSVRRVNEVRSLVYRLLYDRGDLFFEEAKPVSPKRKKIHAVIVGLGRHGTEMLKALAWFCQMDGYQLEIDAFDEDTLAGDRFEASAPELISPEYNGAHIPGEADYTIRIHSGYDVTTKSFADQISALTDTTYVFVSLGDDERNIRAAVELRMLFERINGRPWEHPDGKPRGPEPEHKPVIHSIVYSADKRRAYAGITSCDGWHYEIDFIGDIETSYTEAVILHSELEEKARRIHMNFDKDHSDRTFWQYEYNYRSSIASAIHAEARRRRGIPWADKAEEELTAEEKGALRSLEHRRWNAYMRGEGYIYSNSTDKSSRNDLAKKHNDLVRYSCLNKEERKKDSLVGGKLE